METSDQKRDEGEHGNSAAVPGKYVVIDHDGVGIFVFDQTYLEPYGLITAHAGMGCSAELSKMPEGIEGVDNPVYYFNRIKVSPNLEGTGVGRALMIEVCKLADKHGITIFNGLNPYGKRDLESLKNFFRDSGFETFQDETLNQMIRKPNTMKGKLMGLLGGSIREGSWWLNSKSDPRWDCNGRGTVGGLVVPAAATEAMDRIKKELNEEPPEDLEYGYMKD